MTHSIGLEKYEDIVGRMLEKTSNSDLTVTVKVCAGAHNTLFSAKIVCKIKEGEFQTSYKDENKKKVQGRDHR